MIVYLDNAILSRLEREPGLLRHLRVAAQQRGMRFAISPNHSDDLAAATPSGRQSRLALAQSLRATVWCLGGNSIPPAELAALVGGEKEPPKIVFDDADDLVTTHQQFFIHSGVQAESPTHHAQLRVRVDAKRIGTTTTQEMKDFLGAGPAAEDPLQSILELPDGDMTAEAQARWQQLVDGYSTDEMADALRQLESQDLLPGIAPNVTAEQFGAWKQAIIGLASAARSQDRVKAAEFLQLVHAAEQAINDAANPLGHGARGDNFQIFPYFWYWLPDEFKLQNPSRTELRALFRRWRAATGTCGGGLCFVETYAQMMRDAGTTAKESDTTDLMHVATLPYVDVLFVDARIAEYARRSPNIVEEYKDHCQANAGFDDWLEKQLLQH